MNLREVKNRLAMQEYLSDRCEFRPAVVRDYPVIHNGKICYELELPGDDLIA